MIIIRVSNFARNVFIILLVIVIGSVLASSIIMNSALPISDAVRNTSRMACAEVRS
jgi:hypothetical protein